MLNEIYLLEKRGEAVRFKGYRENKTIRTDSKRPAEWYEFGVKRKLKKRKESVELHYLFNLFNPEYHLL